MWTSTCKLSLGTLNHNDLREIRRNPPPTISLSSLMGSLARLRELPFTSGYLLSSEQEPHY